MKALYRRYRPCKLSEVIGQDKIVQALQKSIDNKKISHAYLFVGPRGTGKTSVARIFAHTINDFPYELEDDYLDIIEIDAASNRGIDNIRELREKANLAPVQGKYKVYIIDEVHMLTKEAFNALLKTLEEPPEHIVFIMATTDAHKVPVTITSRSQTHVFHLADQATMVKYLREVCDKEKINIADDALELLYKHGGGSFRDTLSLLDQISTIESDGNISRNDIIDALGLPDDTLIAQLLNAYHTQDSAQIKKILEQLYNASINATTITSSLIDLILQNPEPNNFSLLNKLVEQSKPNTSYPEVRLLLALIPTDMAQPQTKIVSAQIKSTLTQKEDQISKQVEQTVQEVTLPQKTLKEETSVTEKSEITKETSPEGTQESDDNNHATNDLWQKILNTVAEKANTISSYLNNAQYTNIDHIFTIYANSEFKKKRIEGKRSVILSALPEGYELVITDKNKPNTVVDNILDIMGGGEIIKQ